MSRAYYGPVLSAVYRVWSELIWRGQMPTQPIQPTQTALHALERKHLRYFASGGRPTMSRRAVSKCIAIFDYNLDKNRFTGQSFSGEVPSSGGFYCSLQQRALENELLESARHRPKELSGLTGLPLETKEVGRDETTGFPKLDEALKFKFVATVHPLSPVLAADLSFYNPRTQEFFQSVEKSDGYRRAAEMAARSSALYEKPIWDQLFDGEDYSVARGIGLAVAHSGFCRALIVRTARPSPRGPEESGDNLVFFGHNGPVQGLSVEKVYAFPPAWQDGRAVPGDRPVVFELKDD